MFEELFRGWKDVRSFKAGSQIYSDKEPADVLFVVLSGEVELRLRGEPLATEEPGGIIGEMAMVESTLRSATATALSDVELAAVDREQLRSLVKSNPDFSYHLMSVLANRLRLVDHYISRQFEQRR